MLSILVNLINKIFGKKYASLKHKIRRKYPFLNFSSSYNSEFKDYRKSFSFSDKQLAFYFLTLFLSGLLMVFLFAYNTILFKEYNISIIVFVMIVAFVYDIYPRIVNIRKRNILRKRKNRLIDKINKIFILDIKEDRNSAFQFAESIELKKNKYISWEHELKLLAIEKKYNVIFNIMEIGDGYIRVNFGIK